MSKELATIITDVPLEYDFSEAELSSVSDLYTPEAFELCKKLAFKNLLGRFSVEAPKNNAQEFFRIVKDKNEAEKIWEKASDRPLAFYIIKGEKKEESGQLSLFDEPSDKKEISAMAITFSEEDSYLFTCGEELSPDWLTDKLLSDKNRVKIAPDLKPQLKLINFSDRTDPARDWEAYKEGRESFFDRTIAAYLLNPLKGEYPFDEVAKDYLGIDVPSRAQLLGKETPAEVLAEDENKALMFACWETYTAWKSYPVLNQKLDEEGMASLMKEIEMPLAFVLYDMEREGISMDATALKEYGSKLSVSIDELEQKIYEQAGEKFNINSPKQLGVILFEKLKLPGSKKTKTGYSTAAEVLEKLAPDHPIVADILEYRKLAKLKSTYADGLVNFLAEDGRVHTTFNQTITATGRLSSTDPNLQNIPIRIELGKMIRKVFHPKDGYVFVDSDYSQIELRLLAHMSGDEQLIEAFSEKQDIHRSTASKVFHVPFDEVTELQRRNAKAVNFGIVYGISAYGLSQDLGIGTKEAQGYIDSYFKTYPSIKAFLDKSVADAKNNGKTSTLYGRIRPIPELRSSNFMQRQFGERVAMNAPIQGTAADVIKIAMIRVHDRLLREGFSSRLILQVHDELLIETAEAEKDKVIALLEEEMRGAADFSVELEVGTESGHDWYEAH
jgi:DNA polymerase-1